jgi:hypothetical protein
MIYSVTSNGSGIYHWVTTEPFFLTQLTDPIGLQIQDPVNGWIDPDSVTQGSEYDLYCYYSLSTVDYVPEPWQVSPTIAGFYPNEEDLIGQTGTTL